MPCQAWNFEANVLLLWLWQQEEERRRCSGHLRVEVVCVRVSFSVGLDVLEVQGALASLTNASLLIAVIELLHDQQQK